MATGDTPTITLNDGAQIPRLGFGVFQLDREHTSELVGSALSAGYRHVDTAAAYANEAEVGRAVRGHDGYVHVTTKYFDPSDDHGYQSAKRAFAASLDRLGLSRIDLYLVHWPVRAGQGFTEAWRALAELREEPGLTSIGVSNFSSAQLAEIVDATGVTPAVNQVELHPYFQQRELRADHATRGIATEAWGPLGQGDRHEEKVLEDPLLAEIATAHERTVAQVVIRWHLQLGTIAIPKSATPERIAANANVFDFELSEDDMAAIASLDRGGRNGPDPDVYDFPKDYLGQAHQGS